MQLVTTHPGLTITHPELMPDHDATDQLLSHGAGPGLVVLLHAAGSGPRGLDRLARQLAASGWRTAAPLLERGGDSLVAPPPHGGDAFAAVTGLVRRLLDGGAGPRVLLGHSMGGHAVLRALADGIEAQAAILYEPIALALLDPADPTDSPLLAADAACITAFREAVAAGNPEPGLRGFIEAYGEHAWGELPPAVRADLLARASALLAAATATNAAPIEPAEMARIEIPVLLLTGTRSPPILGRMVRRLAALMPSAEVVAIPEAGHMGPVARPDIVADAIRAFLARRLTTGP